MKLLDGLNPEQRRAVETTEGPVLVLAGAGTGKTRVITTRIAHLLRRGVAPESVLAVTFTNKAAREMRERVQALVGEARAGRLFVGTFHAFCVAALREHGAALELPRFSIRDGSDQISVLRGVLRELTVGEARLQPAALQARISLHKNRLADPESLLRDAKDDEDELVAKAWGRYEEKLRGSRTLDFDDLLLYALRLLRQDGPRQAFRERFRYVMVDEYQDTNGPQYEIVRAIAGGHRNLCVVGDDDQSIYGWRGADVRKILGFERDFPGAAVVRLETNYRSTEPILAAANRVIRNNPDRHEKSLRSALGPGDPVQGVFADDEDEEADWIVRDVQEQVRLGRCRLGDVAVLYRTGPQSRAFETQLRARGVPYVLVGGMSFFDRKEVRDVLAYLRLVAEPDDEVSFLRVVDAPPRGLGAASVEKLLRFATEHGLGISAAAERAAEVPGLQAGPANAARELFRTLATVRAQQTKVPLVGLIERLLEAVGYRSEVERCYPDEPTRAQRWEGVEEVLGFAESHARRKKGASLATFLQDLALSADDDATPEDAGRRDALTLMTLHAAKGLEFPRVYVVGLEEGLLPHARAVAEGTVEEERRLMYVGITRAQRHLVLTCAKHRARHGHRIETVPSRFLFELKGETPPKGWNEPRKEAGRKGKGGKARKGAAKGGARGRAARRR